MSWAEAAGLIGHGDLLAGLWAAAGRGHLPHALSFEGPEGVGKFLAALRLVNGLLCERGPGAPCVAAVGEKPCGPCLRFRSGNHLDVHVVDPQALGIELIPIHYVTRRLPEPVVEVTIEEALALRPAEGGWRAVIVRDAELMNEAAQSALLKTLEEPGHAVLLLLETSRPHLLLETVHSRCVRVRFEPLTEAQTLAVLAREGLAEEEAATLARWSRGAPGRALAMARRGALEMRALMAAVLAGELDPLEAATRLQQVEGDFRGTSERAPARQRARAATDLALEVARDLSRVAAGVPSARAAHGDLADGAGKQQDPGDIGRCVDELLQARQDVEMNLSPEGVLDRAMLALSRCARRATKTESETRR